MTATTNRRRRRTVSAMILVVGVLLALAIWFWGPAIFADIITGYESDEVTPDGTYYCPGDTLRFSYTLTRNQPGPIRIIRGWCRRVDGICSLANTIVDYGVIVRPYAPLVSHTSRVIPKGVANMTPGSVWEYVNAVESLAVPGSADWYSVPFTIAADCPPAIP